MKFFDSVLMEFRGCFTRKKAFAWFVVIVAGIMARSDSLGVTSVMRSLLIDPSHYVPLLAFFRSNAWSLDTLVMAWCAIVCKYAPIVRYNGAAVLPADGMKKMIEGRRMPGAKKLHQESENSGKQPYIWGHMFGAVGVLAVTGSKCFCIPLAITLQDGVRKIFGWGAGKGAEKERQGSHVVELVQLAHRVAAVFGRTLALMDSLYLSVPALKMLDLLNSYGQMMHIITRAKKNCKAFLDPPPKPPGSRGRPRKKGDSVKLACLFESEASRFTEAVVRLYGRKEAVYYYCVDMLWGAKLYKKLRFVLTVRDGARTILVSTDLTIDPVDIIELYGRRFKVECMFREMKQSVCAFRYRFWSKLMPKLSKRRKQNDPDPMESVTDAEAREAIKKTVKATEGYVFCGAVATGLLQMASLLFSSTPEFTKLRYLRTRRNDIESEATVGDYLRRNILILLLRNADLDISKIIIERQIKEYDCGYHQKVS